MKRDKTTIKLKSFMADMFGEVCKRVGARLIMGPKLGASGQILFPGGKKVSFFNCCFDINPYGSSMIARNKGLTRIIMKKEGVNMAPGKYFSLNIDEFRELSKKDLEDLAVKYAKKIGFPVMAKGADQHRGSCVFKVNKTKELRNALEEIWGKTDGVVIEKFLRLDNFRIIYFDGKIVGAYGTHPFHIIGDGITTIKELLLAAIEENKKNSIGTNFVILDKEIKTHLEKAGYKENDIVPEGEEVLLSEVSNISMGGIPRDVTGIINNGFQEYCQKIMKTLNLRFAGIDILAADIRNKPEKSFLLEVNSSPCLEIYSNLGINQKERTIEMLRGIVMEMKNI